MSQSDKDSLIHEIGGMVLSDPEYLENPWDASSIVVTLGDGMRSMEGYRYFGGDDFEPSTPEGAMRPFFAKFADLREAMREETDSDWVQCLVQISHPGPQIKMQFEYDDPTRWNPKQISMDMSEHANSLKP